MNSPMLGPGASQGELPTPAMIAAVTSKYWGPAPRTITVQFLDDPSKGLRTKILSHMNAWSKTACIRFAETEADGQVRVSRSEAAGGCWSYIGTDILMVPKSHQTMNLEGFTAKTKDETLRRIVRHEAGHTMGFTHEHMRADIISRIDVAKAEDYFRLYCGWDTKTTQAQVLTPIEARSLMGTPADKESIMCYQLPGAIMRDGLPVEGGQDIDESDYAFAARVYPRAAARPSAVPAPPLMAPSLGRIPGSAQSPTAPVVDWGPSPWPLEADVIIEAIHLC